MHEAYVSTQLLKLPGTLTIESFARYDLIESLVVGVCFHHHSFQFW